MVGRLVLVGRRLLRRMLRLLRGWVLLSVGQVRVGVVKALVAGSPVVPVGGCRVARLVAGPVVVVLLVAAVSPTAAELVQRPVLVVRCRVRVAWQRLPVNLLAVPVLVVALVVSVVLCHRPRVEMPPVGAAPGCSVVTVVVLVVRLAGVMVPVGVSPVRLVAQPVAALQVWLRVVWAGPRPGRRRAVRLPAVLQVELLVVVRRACRELLVVLRVWLVQVRAGRGLRRVPVVVPPVVLLAGLVVVVAYRRRSRLVVLVVGVGKSRGRRRFSTMAPGFLTRRVEFRGRGVR
ncbi:hypothetical protein CXF32_00045 [Corynebacterium bovis]|nr:hypothetical protein CXF32_00045 [Corynebacterium bovis]RRQ00668.1 hypothetical protein CXF31_00060 [Corynebacterium bovis]